MAGERSVERSVTIGKHAGCDLVVDDDYASAYHCRITRDPDGVVWVADLGSTNGTYLARGGGARVQVTRPVRVEPGDVLWVGRTAIPLGPREPIRVQAEVRRG